MKKLIAILCVFSLYDAHAQKFYAGLGGGAQWPFLPQPINYSYVSSQPVTTYSLKNGSYASGYNVHGFIGYNLNQHIAFEVGSGYVFAKEYTVTSNLSSVTLDVKETAKTTLNLVNVSAAIKMTAPLTFADPYLKVGMLTGFASATTKKESSNSSSNTHSTSTTEYTGNIAWGAFSSIGFRKNLGTVFAVYAEFVLMFQTYSPVKSTLTEYTVNGQDNLGSLKTRDKETEYSDSYTLSPSDDEPTKSRPITFYASTMGIQVGIIARLGSKKK